MIKIEFQYKLNGKSRPSGEIQVEELGSNGEHLPIPGVGDTVMCNLEGKPGNFKVLTRHFHYLQDDDGEASCFVNIVVTDVKQSDMDARLKA